MKKIISSISILGIVIFLSNSLGAKTTNITDNITTATDIAAFEIKSMEIDEDGLLNFTTVGESGCIIYSIEQYMINQWVVVKTVEGKGSASENSYTVSVVFNSGKNQIRLKHKGINDKMTRISDPINYESTKRAVKIKESKNNKVIDFTDNTYYVLYNPYGEIVKSGAGKSVDLSSFKKGDYYLVYDNKFIDFEKTKSKIIKGSDKVIKIRKHKRPIRNPYSRYKIN